MSHKFFDTSFLNTVKNWNIKDYFRQLSIVIVGIVITFLASDVISYQSKQKEVEKITGMIKEELKDNLKSLYFLQSRLELEFNLYDLIRKNLNDFSNLPQDSLQKSQSLPGNDYRHLFKTQSFDVFKNSGLIPHIKNKVFLNKLFSCYNSLQFSQEWINTYYNDKTKATQKWLSTLSIKEAQHLYKEEADSSIDPSQYWKLILANDNTRNFYINALGYLETIINECQKTEKLLQETLQNFE